MRRMLTVAAVAALIGGVSPAQAEPVQASPGRAATIGGVACTLGFLLAGSDGAAYMTTAGHCVFPDGGTRAWPRGTGPVVETEQGRIGRVAFAENMPSVDGDDEYDFAVIRLDDEVVASAAVDGVSAPTGLNEERTPVPTRLRTYAEATGPAASRELLARSMDRPEFVYAYGATAPGVYGGPVVDDSGRAVGTLLGSDDGTYEYGPEPEGLGREGALNRIGRLGPVLVHAAFATRTRFTLVLESS